VAVKALPARATFPPYLPSTTASATFSYIWDLSRSVDAGNDQAEPCWIPIPSCKNSHASPGGSARLRTASPPVPEMPHVGAVPAGAHGGKVPPT